MSSELEAVGNALFDNKVPDFWAERSYPSIKPLASYIADFVERLNFIGDWIEHGKPTNFWISGFYFTQSFFTGIKQNFARKYTIAIDLIQFDFDILSDKVDTTKMATDGAYVHGLFLEGCRWDSDQMALEESHDKVLFTKMPSIWFKPVEQSKIPVKHSYDCPVYKTLARFGTLSTTGHSTNYVLTIAVPILKRHTSAHWTKRGVAMVTQLSD
jgi:dynein heavy chain